MSEFREWLQCVSYLMSDNDGFTRCEWISRRETWWVSEWFTEWVNKWVRDSLSECLSEWVSQWVSVSASDWLSEWVSQWVSDSVSECLSEWVSQWVRDSVTERISDRVTQWVSVFVLIVSMKLSNPPPRKRCILYMEKDGDRGKRMQMLSIL